MTDCHISLNSIHNGLYARTCLMSRASYKGLKIEWDEDECSLPLPELKPVTSGSTVPKTKITKNPVNRFQLLGIDGDETEDGKEEDDDDDDDDAMSTTNMTALTIDARTPWDASSSIATAY